MPSRHLIVDGHSIIFHWAELRRIHERNRRQARAELVRQLTAYQDSADEHVIVVFDGRGPRVEKGADLPGAIQVIYASGGATADSVIEKLVAKYAGSVELTVATGDEAERLTVSALGAWWLSPEGLRERIRTAAHRAARQWKKRKPAAAGTPIGDAFPPSDRKGGPSG